MILDIPRHYLLVTFNEGRIIQRVTNKQLLEHPEKPLWSFRHQQELFSLRVVHLIPLCPVHLKPFWVAQLNRCHQRILTLKINQLIRIDDKKKQADWIATCFFIPKLSDYVAFSIGCCSFSYSMTIFAIKWTFGLASINYLSWFHVTKIIMIPEKRPWGGLWGWHICFRYGWYNCFRFHQDRALRRASEYLLLQYRVL